MKPLFSFDEKISRRKINPASKFVLIGNNIDGWVEIGIEKFQNFADVMKRLPNLLKSFRAAGEWDLKLYQVPDNYKIITLFDYYKKPNRGRLIYNHDYNETPVREVFFKKNEMIVLNAELDHWKNQTTKNKDAIEFELYLTINKTILLI